MRLEWGFVLALLAGPVAGETAADCETLVQAVESLTGFGLTAPPAAPEDGWCVLDDARMAGDQAPQVTATRLRLTGTQAEGALMSLEIDGAGLRMRPALNDRDMPGWLRELLRLQSAEVHLRIWRDKAADRLVLEGGRIALSGGGELVLAAEIAGASLSSASILTGRLTALHLEWQNDGRTLRPGMEALGAGIRPAASGTGAVLAARDALLAVVKAVPDASLPDDAADALARFIAALPQGRGRLVLDLAAEAGIGAVELGLLALSDDPAGPEALGRLMAGTVLTADWQPGLAP